MSNHSQLVVRRKRECATIWVYHVALGSGDDRAWYRDGTNAWRRNNFGVLRFPPGLPSLGITTGQLPARVRLSSLTFLPTRGASRKESQGGWVMRSLGSRPVVAPLGQAQRKRKTARNLPHIKYRIRISPDGRETGFHRIYYWLIPYQNGFAEKRWKRFFFLDPYDGKVYFIQKWSIKMTSGFLRCI